MNVELLRKSGNIIFECISGSRMYSTHTKESDLDIRGVFILPNEEYLTLTDPIQQVSDDTNDITFYSLKRLFELLKSENPNMLELLYAPKDCIITCNPIMQKVIDNRHLFVSLKSYYTHTAYAFAQCKKAKGTNKWINNPKPETPPNKMDFCWIIPFNQYLNYQSKEEIIGQIKNNNSQPFRPIPLKELSFDLSKFHCAGLEHVENTYRLYLYNENSKGVFRGPNQQLVVESIPFDDEWDKLFGLMIYNENAYNSAYRDWKNYWTWKKERNEARYRAQEKGEIDFDAKSMMHCMRLLFSGKNILLNGKPIVRFEGEQLQLLKDIRAGKYSYDELMNMMENEMAELEIIKEKSLLPHSVDDKAIEELYKELIHME